MQLMESSLVDAPDLSSDVCIVVVGAILGSLQSHNFGF